MDQQQSSVRHRHATNPTQDISTAERDEKTSNGAVKEQGGKGAPDPVKRRQSSSDGPAGWMAMLTKPVDPLTLAVFRFLFGAAMVVHIVRAVLTQDVIEANFQDFFPETNFHYYFAMNVWKPPVDVTWFIFWACALCRPLLVLLFCYVTAQCLVPFRHWLYPGDVNWTMEGHQFSWRMMLNAEDVVLRTLIRPQDGAEVVHTGYQLNARQMKRMITDPEMILQYAQYLGREHMQTTGSPASVRLDMWRSLNNRPFQRWVDPSVDLTTTDYWAFHYAWLEPQLPDSALDFSEMDRIRAEARDHGKMASFFMDKPGGVFKTTLQAGGPCSNVTLLAVSGDVTVQVRKVHTPVPVGTEFALPATGGFHRVRTGGDGPAAVWAYLHDCSPGHFHDTMMMTSMDSWEL
ncbi:hypothetical protein Bbelb_173380 [Branchiostoma belcheri]|nr:hypothetical protein Bbelb_173380 [Branchiostoma belcheri]